MVFNDGNSNNQCFGHKIYLEYIDVVADGSNTTSFDTSDRRRKK